MEEKGGKYIKDERDNFFLSCESFQVPVIICLFSRIVF